MMGIPGTSMKNCRAVLTLVGLVAAVAVAYANPSVFSYFRAVAQNDDIVLQWRSMSETGVQYFDIERSSEDVPEFRRLERIAARGTPTSYSYTDNGAFYKPTTGKRFSYRIRATGSAGDQYSPVQTVVHEVSSVKRSWGMIKELFR
jgi:hypothetical protein